MLNRILDGLDRHAGWLFCAAAGIASMEVVLRYVFRAPTQWGHELVIAFCAVGYLIAGAPVERAGQHIRITSFYDTASAGVRRAFDWIAGICGLIFLAGLGWGAWNQFLRSVWAFDGARWLPETTGRAWNVPLPPVLRFVFIVAVILFALALIARRISTARSDAKAGSEAQ